MLGERSYKRQVVITVLSLISLGLVENVSATEETLPDDAAQGVPAFVCPDLDNIELRTPPAGLFQLEVPIVLNGFDRGAVAVRLSAEGEAFILLDSLRRVLDGLLAPSVFTCITRFTEDKVLIPVDTLSTFGIEVEFNSGLVRLEGNITTALLLPQEIGFNTREPVSISQEFIPNIAAALNIFAGQSFLGAGRGSDPFRQGASVALEGNVRLFGANGVTINGLANVNEGAESVFQRGAVSVSYDHIKSATRLTIGDIAPVITGFQGSTSVGGVSFGREFSIQPFRLTTPTGRRQFTLDRAANAKVVINDRVIRDLRLSPGVFDLRDIPFVNGANDVEIQIEDAAGRSDVIRFNAFFDNTLLEPGLSEFAVSAGFESDLVPGGISYDTDRPVASGFYRRGVLDNLTLGANAQGDADGAVFGLDAVLATRFGSFDVESAVSRRFDDLDVAASVTYERLLGANRTGGYTLSASATYLGERFAPIGVDGLVDNDESLELSGRVGGPVGLGINGSLGATYSLRRNEEANDSFFDLAFSRQFLGRFNLSSSVSYERIDGESSVAGLLTLTVGLGRRSSLTLNQSTATNLTTASFVRPGTGRVGSLGFSANASRDPDNVVVGGDLTYTANRGVFNVSHTNLFASEDDAFAQTVTTLSAASSVVYAGGRFGVGRPVGDAFALIDGHPTLDGKSIIVDPSDVGPVAKSGLLGAAVVPDFQSYRRDSILVEVQDVPLGVDTGPGVYDITLPLGGGAAIQVGSGASVSIIGVLVKASGAPLELVSGNLRSLSNTDQEPIFVFTNRAGRFAVEGLKAGRYRIELDNGFATTIEIENNAIGIIRLGELQVSRTNDEE